MDRKAKLEELRLRRNQQQSLLSEPIEIKHRNFNPTTQNSVTSFDFISKEPGIIQSSTHPLLEHEKSSEDLTRILLSKYDRMANKLNRKILKINENEVQNNYDNDEDHSSGFSTFNKDDEKIAEYDDYLKPSTDILFKKTDEKIRGLSKLRVREAMNKIND